MATIIDQARAAARADVCSLYLMDRDGTGVTLAATNGLDRETIGVAQPALGQGLTGLAARDRAPVTSDDVHFDPRFAWIRGVDQARYTSMCSVPLMWNEQVVGVVNVQTVERRIFSPADIRFLETLAGLLAGLVEKSAPPAGGVGADRAAACHRRGARQPGRDRHPRAADAAGRRACLHRAARRPHPGDRAAGRRRLGAAGARPGGPARPHGRLDPPEHAGLPQLADGAGSRSTSSAVAETEARDVAPMLRRHTLATTFETRPLMAIGSDEIAPAAARLPARERVEVRAGRRHDRHLRLAAERPRVPGRHGRRPGHPREVARDDLRAVRPAGRFTARRGHWALRRPPPGARDGRRPARRGARAVRQPVRAGAGSPGGSKARP